MTGAAADSPMRLLVLTDRYPPWLIGGYEVACQSVTERLRSMGHDVRVLTSRYGVRRRHVAGHVERVLHRPQDCRTMFDLGLAEAQDQRELRRLVRTWRPDVIYAWCLNQLFGSLHRSLRELSVPVVLNIQDSWLPTHMDSAARRFELWHGPARPALKRFAKGAVARVLGIQRTPLTVADLPLDEVVFCSAFRQSEHSRLGLPLGRGVVIHNGVDRAQFRGAPDGGGALRALFVGRLVREKGVHTAVDAIQLLRARGVTDVGLDIAAVPAYPWEYQRTLIEDVERNGLRDHIRFLPQVPHAAMSATYREHNVLVFPSAADEGLPVAIVEAMACGLAVVATRTGGTPEIVEDGTNGLLVEREDSAAVADALLRLRNHPAHRRELALQGMKTVQTRFDIASIAAETEAHLRSIVGQRRRDAHRAA